MRNPVIKAKQPTPAKPTKNVQMATALPIKPGEPSEYMANCLSRILHAPCDPARQYERLLHVTNAFCAGLNADPDLENTNDLVLTNLRAVVEKAEQGFYK